LKNRSHPKVLLNATTIIKGGGVQAVVSFIRSLMDVRELDDLDWHLILSPVVNRQLEQLNLKINFEKDLVLPDSPAKSFKSRNILRDYVEKREIDCVFTFFGPAYVKFPVLHICGVADGWVTHSDLEAYSKIHSWLERLKVFLLCLYKGFWFRRADAWFVEQEAARKGLAGRFGIQQEDVTVIANNCAEHYHDFKGLPLLDGDTMRVLIFASYYPNKNIELVPYIANALKEVGRANIEFILTIHEDDPGLNRVMMLAKSLDVEKSIRNIGPVDVLDGPALYRSCKILLMPSILETFSAVYPEAMCMGLPIVTADKYFSRAICDKAACYYESDNANEAANLISKLLRDETYYNHLVAEGRRRLSYFPSAKQKYKMLHDMVSKYVK